MTSATGWPVPIGIAAQRAGVSARMVRHYESLGLLPRGRTDSGYRQYTEAEVHALRFIRRRARPGFLHGRDRHPARPVARQGTRQQPGQKHCPGHIDDLATRIAAMQAMQRTLQSLVQCCHGDDRPDCPILDDLAATGDGAPAKQNNSCQRFLLA